MSTAMAKLPTRPLGDSGLEVSIVGLGCNQFGRRLDLEGTRAVVEAALEHGVTFFDTADTYGRGRSEEYLGQLIEGRRDQVVLATKFGLDMGDGKGPRGSRDYILQAFEASRQRLRTDVIDVYYYHRPDGVTPIEETLGTLNELVQAGSVRVITASNFSAEQIDEAEQVARDHGFARFVAIQNEYNLLVRGAETDVIPACERLGLGFVPFYPLAAGLLTGKYRRGEPGPPGARLTDREHIATDEQYGTIAALERYAAERGISLVEVATGALIARPVVSSVIAGATSPDQVRTNAAAARWQPSDKDLSALSKLLGPAEQ
jgi:aryl-alcohol dehydrogenase-like predicted oxidoreductase